MPRPLSGYGSFVGRLSESGELSKHAARVARSRLTPLAPPPFDLFCRNLELQQPPCSVDREPVALLDRRERPADERRRRVMADDHAARATGNPPVGDESVLVAEPAADDRRGRREHLRHAWTSLRTEIAQHEHVA